MLISDVYHDVWRTPGHGGSNRTAWRPSVTTRKCLWRSSTAGDWYCCWFSKKNRQAERCKWSATRSLQFLLCATRCSVRTDRGEYIPKLNLELWGKHFLIRNCSLWLCHSAPCREEEEPWCQTGLQVSGELEYVLQQIQEHLRPLGVLGDSSCSASCGSETGSAWLAPPRATVSRLDLN